MVLLAAFVIMGGGSGASGACTSLVGAGTHAVVPQHARDSDFYSEYIGDGSTCPLIDWLVFEVLGIFAGAHLRNKGGPNQEYQ